MRKLFVFFFILFLSLAFAFLIYSWVFKVSYFVFISGWFVFFASFFISFSIVASVFIFLSSFRDFLRSKIGSKIRFRLIVLFTIAGFISSLILSVIFVSIIDAFRDVVRSEEKEMISDISKGILNDLSSFYKYSFFRLEEALKEGRGVGDIHIVKLPYSYNYGVNPFFDNIWDQLRKSYSDEGRSFVVFGESEYLFVFKKVSDGFLVSYSKVGDSVYSIKKRATQMLKVSSSIEFLLYDVFGRYIAVIILLLNIPSFFISILVAYLFSEYISQGISKLATGLSEVSKGNLNYVVSSEGTIDEIKYLIDQFNVMTMKLLEAHYRVSKIEKMELWKDIARKFSHEIKNPLTPIKLSIQRILLNQDAPDFKEKTINSLNVILDEVERIDRLVTQLSNFAKIPLPNKTNFSFYELMQQIRELFSNQGIDFEIIVDGNDMVYADFDQIKQCLINLVKNGIEASEGISNKITIKFVNTGEKVIISVRDYGVGISEDMKNNILKPYITTKKTGSGLGLSIVESIVFNHGGELYFSSKVGEGSEFFIELPLKEK